VKSLIRRTDEPSVSFVVSTSDRADSLFKLLRALDVQNYPSFDVIVVVGPTTDNTLDVLADRRERVTIVECPDRNLARSRNLGIAASSADLVALVDDDAIPNPEWLRQLVPVFEDPTVGATGGITYDWSGVRHQAVYSWASTTGFAYTAQEQSTLQDLDGRRFFAYPIGTNCVLRRAAVLAVGGFDEEIEYCHDETDLILRLADAGYSFSPVASGYVIHEAAPSHVRNDGPASNRYPIIKNWTFFALKHGLPATSSDAVVESIGSFVDLEARVAVSSPNWAGSDWGHVERGARRAFGRWAADGCRTRPAARSLWIEGPPGAAYASARYQEQRAQGFSVAVVMPDFGSEAPGGIERVYREIVRGLARRGYPVHVLTGLAGPAPRRTEAAKPSVQFMPDGFWLHRLAPDPTGVPGGLGLDGAIWGMPHAVQSAVERIEMDEGPLAAVICPNWGSWGLGVALRGSTPLILGIYTPLAKVIAVDPRFNADSPDVRRAIAAEALCLRLATALALTTDDVIDDLCALYGDFVAEKPSCVVPLSLSLDPVRDPSLALKLPFRHRGDRGGASSAAGLTVGFVGRHEPRKGVDVALEAFIRAGAVDSSMTFLLAGKESIDLGDGTTFRARYAEGLEFLEREGRLAFLGEVDDEHLSLIYAACDIVVMPSRFESFGLVLLEAMAHGAIPVASDVGGIPAVVPRDWGTLVAPGDVEGLVRVLQELASNPEERSELSRRARTRALRELTPDLMLDRLEQLVRATVGANEAFVTA
jgi:glycogen(starch) synthase